MLQQKIKIINRLGLHARAATKFSNVAKKHNCDIKVALGNKTIDGKSIMSLMLLAAAKGSSIELIMSGPDENNAMLELTNLINNYFDEGE